MAFKTGVPNWAKAAALVVLFVAAIGVLIGVVDGGFLVMWKVGRSSNGSWWQYALAVPVMGAIALGGEAVGEWVIGPFLAWRKADQPRWRRLAFFGLVFGAMAAGLIWIFVFQE
jgi:hypothetical protein